MTDPLDTLDLADGTRLAIVNDADGLAAVPMVRDRDQQWHRAQAGDGVAEDLVNLLAQNGYSVIGRFTVRSWTRCVARDERAIGVDQTNESVIVGDAAVVKWATHLQDGPHPAPHRIGVLRDAGFGGIPSPWGLVTWRPPHGAETLVAYVDEYLPGAVDGWTWAVDLVTEAARDRHLGPAVTAAANVGVLIAELHAALAGTATVASGRDATRWRDDALDNLESVCSISDFAARRRNEIATELAGLGTLAATPVIDGHGDLHVGQVLRDANRYVVTDFDGNPVLPAAQRVLPIPAALDVAGMIQSLAHVGIVARKYADLHPLAMAEVERTVRHGFLDAYTGRLAHLGHADLFQPAPLRAFRMQQVLRESIYAARHLPRWMYVPDAALPALLDEGSRT